MATKKLSELTTTTSPNSASIFAIAYSGSNFGVTLANVAANLPAVTAASITSSSTLTTTGNATIGGDLTITGDDLFMGTNTSGAALIADGTNFNPVVISGDIAIATNGAATIQADAVEGSMLNDNVISGQTEISSGLADADELLYSDAGTLKKVGMDTMKTYFSPVAGSSSIVTTGTISSGTWEATDIGVAHGGTGASSLTANGVLIGNGTSAVTAVDLSTKGKLLIGDGSGNPSALAVGSNNHVLTADSSEGTGIKWAAVPATTPTDITVADESSDTTCFPLFVTAATGDLVPKTGSNLAFNSSSGLLTATGFSGPLTGNVTGNASGSSGSCTGNSATATTSTNVTVADESSDTTCFPLFVTAATGDLPPKSGSNLAFNSSSGVLTATGFAGDITGNVTGNASGSAGSCTGNSATATTSTNVTVADESSDTTCFPLFVTAATGDLAPKSGSNLAFNSSSGVLTATGFAGDITGNVTGNTSGTSGSTTGNAATATALATARNIGGVSFDGTGNIDLPGVNAAGSQNTSGTAAGLSSTLAVSSGGTGATSLTANGVLIGNGTSAIASVDMSTKGKILIGDGSGNPSLLTVGANDTILTADSSEATGVKWAAAGGGGGLAVISAVNEYNASANTTSYSFTGFDSTYDNYYVIIHAITQQADGDIQMRFLDDGSAITASNYRQTTLGLTNSNSEKRITTTAEDKFTIVQQMKGGLLDPTNGFMYFNNGAGGRWDSDSDDSKGAVSPSFVYQVGGEGSNGSSRIAQGHGYINDTAANTCNGFQLIFAGGDGASKINMTIYGVKRS